MRALLTHQAYIGKLLTVNSLPSGVCLTTTANNERALSAKEIVALSTRHTLFDWMPQKSAAPLAVSRASGVYFYTPDGERWLDFNSQLMGVNVGHGHPHIVEAIQRQAAQLAY